MSFIFSMTSKEILKEIVTENYFCVRYKNKRKHNQHFELLFFHDKFTLWHIKLSKYREINLLVINSIYLVFFSREVQRIFIQTKVYHKFIYCLKRNDSQTFKSIATAKKLFSSVYVLGTTCFDKLFLFHVTTDVFYKSLLLI